jgi:Protein of unknown function (DUF2852)
LTIAWPLRIYVNVIYIHTESYPHSHIPIHNREAVMPIVAKLDELGRPAWIALMILGFWFWWPLGLATLAFIIGSGRMSCWNHHGMDHWQRKMDRMQEKMDRVRRRMNPGGDWWGHQQSSGNRAFDEYRTETLRRLEEEQREFRDFLDRLRHAKDKAEFDQFMAERRNRPPEASPSESQPQAH